MLKSRLTILISILWLATITHANDKKSNITNNATIIAAGNKFTERLSALIKNQYGSERHRLDGLRAYAEELILTNNIANLRTILPKDLQTTGVD